MTVDPAFLGPDLALSDMIDKAYQAPVMADLSEEQSDALQARLLAARTIDALEPGDRALLEQACAQVDAGLSPTWQDVGQIPGSDWAAEDRLVDVEQAEADQKAFDADGWVGL